MEDELVGVLLQICGLAGASEIAPPRRQQADVFGIVIVKMLQSSALARGLSTRVVRRAEGSYA